MIRKRHIITTIITVIILFLTNSLWMKYKPIEVKFKINGSGNMIVGSKLAGVFFHSSKVYKEYYHDKTNNISLKIDDAKYYSRLELTIDGINLSGGGA